MKQTKALICKMGIDGILKAHFPTFKFWYYCPEKQDRKGGDIKVVVADKHGKDLTHYLDVKLLRENALRTKHEPLSELPIETYSDVHTKTPGWPFRNDVLTTHILWIDESSGNSLLVGFDQLKESAYRNIRDWKRGRKTHRNTSYRGHYTWTGEFLFLPTEELVKAGVELQRNCN